MPAPATSALATSTTPRNAAPSNGGPADGVPDRTYILISPTRDEAVYCRRTLDSVIAQTCRPTRWIIVDDGSTDGTSEILDAYAADHDWIHVVRRPNRGKRSVGPGVIDAFYAGYETIDPAAFTYLCKLDLDLDLPPRYFETLIERMEASPRLGTCSGKAYYPHPRTDQLVSEKLGDEMSAGMTKFYRTPCFEQIGGFVRQVMWDGIDCHRARMLGWQAASWDDSELRFTHLRPMGSSDKGIWRGRMRHGFGQHFMGTSLAYMTASALYRMTRPPYILGGLAMWVGYTHAIITREPRYPDRAFRRFLRRYQWACLFRGKARATADTESHQATHWQPTAAPRP
ncbi:MAG: glycosyltransferase family 2 protein [Phycisphaeraceae bacterium]